MKLMDSFVTVRVNVLSLKLQRNFISIEKKSPKSRIGLSMGTFCSHQQSEPQTIF